MGNCCIFFPCLMAREIITPAEIYYYVSKLVYVKPHLFISPPPFGLKPGMLSVNGPWLLSYIVLTSTLSPSFLSAGP